MRILLADDETRVRYALRVLLERQPGYQVVGEATDAGDLATQVAALDPDLILLDWGLPGSEPGQLLSRLREGSPERIIVVLSGRPEIQPSALKAGADAFACKCDSPAQLLAILDRLPAGQRRGVSG